MTVEPGEFEIYCTMDEYQQALKGCALAELQATMEMVIEELDKVLAMEGLDLLDPRETIKVIRDWCETHRLEMAMLT